MTQTKMSGKRFDAVIILLFYRVEFISRHFTEKLSICFLEIHLWQIEFYDNEISMGKNYVDFRLTHFDSYMGHRSDLSQFYILFKEYFSMELPDNKTKRCIVMTGHTFFFVRTNAGERSCS